MVQFGNRRLIRGIICVLTLIMCLCAATGLARERQIPVVGDVIHGFTAVSSDEIPYLNAKTVRFVHDRTKAQLIYIASDDIERAFSIAYRTPTDNDKGLPHVFEHSTISGSEKYPDPNLFFSMVSQTYTTYLNAETHQNYTMYPSASMSEDQLLKVMDVVLAGLASPVIMTDERAMREAYRYELSDPDADITLTGTVYSEMKGALTVYNTAPQNLAKLLYPGSTRSMEVGGNPSDIPTMTHQELKDFHDAYYHPSNSLMMLYGDLDIDRFLEMIDSVYLSLYDYREIVITDDGYTPVDGYRENVYTFPASADGEAQSTAVYGLSLDGASVEEQILINLAANTMSDEGSDLFDLMNERLPNAQLQVSVATDWAEPTLLVYGIDVNEGDSELFKQTVDEGLALILENGLDEQIMQALCYTQRIQLGLTRESGNIGVSTSTGIMDMWSIDGDPDAYFTFVKVLGNLEKHMEQDDFNAVLRKYLKDVPRSALAITKSLPGELEKADAALKASLTEMKESMTDGEIASLVARTVDFAAWVEENGKSSMIDQVKAISVSELPQDVSPYKASDENVDGMRLITTHIEDSDVVYAKLIFDAGGIPQEKLATYALYAGLLTGMDTEKHSSAELGAEIAGTLYSPEFAASVIETEDGGYRPVLTVNWMCTQEKLAHSFDLVKEILFSTDFLDAERLSTHAMQSLMMERFIIAQQPDTVAQLTGMILIDEKLQYVELLSGDKYTEFMRSLMTMDDEGIANLARDLSEITTYFARRQNFIAGCVGTNEAIKVFKDLSLDLYKTLDPNPIEKAQYTYLGQSQSTALTYDGSMQFNMLITPFKDIGIEYTGKLDVLSSIAYDRVLLPSLRFQNAAYGVRQSINEDAVWVMSYRDPKLSETYEFYNQVGDILRETTLTQDEADGYITSVYSSLAQSPGKMSAGITAISDALTGEDSFARQLTLMRQVKEFTPEDVAKYAFIYDTLAEKGRKVTVGSVQAISENRGLFETIDDHLAALPPEATGYQLGDKVEDFTLTLTDGTQVSLYGLLEEKDAVCLNFWASWCGPCRLEFPYLDKAYAEMSDQIALIAVNIELGDTVEKMLETKEELGLKAIPMAGDSAGLLDDYGLNSFPTTVIIDQNGVVCYKESGGITDHNEFIRLFKLFTGDDYTGPIRVTEIPEALPEIEPPTPEELESALNINDGRLSAVVFERGNIWPFIPASDGQGVMATNGDVKNTMSAFGVEATVDAGQALAYEYAVSCRPIINSLSVYIGEEPVRVYSGLSGEWTKGCVTFDEAGEYGVTFAFKHDQDDDRTGALIRNIRIISAEEAAEISTVRPVGPAKTLPGEECVIEIIDGDIKEAIYSINDEEVPDPKLLVMQSDEFTLHIKTGKDIRDDLAYVYVNAIPTMLIDLEQDEDGYIYRYNRVGQPEKTYPISALTLNRSILEPSVEHSVASQLWFDNENEVDGYLAFLVNAVSSGGFPIETGWRYIDGSAKGTNVLHGGSNLFK